MTKVKYTKELLVEHVQNCKSIAELLKAIGLKLSGGNYCHIQKRLKQYDIDTSHFLGQGINRGKSPNNKQTHQQILIKDKNRGYREKGHKLRRALIEYGRAYMCEVCGHNGAWNDQELILQVDHIDGDFTNNTPDNIRFLCPNCHSQTENYGCKKQKEN